MDASNLRDRTSLSSISSSTLPRRNWLLASLAMATVACTNRWSQAKTSSANSQAGMFRVRGMLEVSGEIRLKSQMSDAVNRNGKKITAKTATLKASSVVDFDEQFETGRELNDCRSYQHFHEANSEIQVDKHKTKTTLREQCCDILRLGNDVGFLVACPNSPLFAAERDLIEGPINTMFIDELLTEKEVKVADKWTVERDVACRLLNLDAIQDGKLMVCLVTADKEKAQLEIEGTIAASVRQVPTSIKVEGKAQLDRAGGFISWLAVNITETREIGEAEPGFEVTAQFKVLRSKIDQMTSGLALDAVVAKMTNKDAASLLQFQSDLGYYRFLASRKWSTYRDNGEEATLRYVVDNRIVAQCNVTNMIDFEPGRQLSLDGFQADVKTAVGNSLIEIVEASERLSTSNHRILKVVSRGGTQGVDIQWIHYHISNDSGRRIVLAFTLNEANLEYFAAEDAQITDSFELVNWPSKLDAKSVEQAAKESESKEGDKLISQPKANDQPNVSNRPKLSR